MDSDEFRWIQMSSDGFVWICMCSDEFNFRFERKWWIEIDSHKFRWNKIDWDGFRWIQMDSNVFKWTEIDSGEMATLGVSARMMGSRAYLAQQPWIQNLTLRLFFINHQSSIIAWEHGLYKYFSSRENILFGRVYEPGRYEETVRVCGLEPDLQVQRIFSFPGFPILGKLHQTNNTILHRTS